MDRGLFILLLIAAIGIGLKISFSGVPGHSMRRELDAINPHRLVAESESMLRSFHRTGRKEGKIPCGLWPDTIRKLKPRTVKTFSRGVPIQEKRSLFRQDGIYVELDSLPFIPCNELQFTFGDSFTPIIEHVDRVDLSVRRQ